MIDILSALLGGGGGGAGDLLAQLLSQGQQKKPQDDTSLVGKYGSDYYDAFNKMMSRGGSGYRVAPGQTIDLAGYLRGLWGNGTQPPPPPTPTQGGGTGTPPPSPDDPTLPPVAPSPGGISRGPTTVNSASSNPYNHFRGKAI